MAAIGAASRITPSCISRFAIIRPSTLRSLGMKVVEAGAQGEHKLARGYCPVITTSAHHLRHPGLSDAVARYLDRERPGIENLRLQMLEQMPFRKAGEPE